MRESRGRHARQDERVPKSLRKGKRAAATVAAAVALAVCIPAVWGFAANVIPQYGWYTSDPSADTFVITNAGEWKALSALVNGKADTNGDGRHDSADAPAQTFEGKTVRLAANLNFLGASVEPLGGRDGTRFDGALDGNGHTVMDATIDAGSSTENIGLIGEAGPASSIANLAVSSSVSVKVSVGKDGSLIRNVGAIVGKTAGPVSKCSSSASIEIASGASPTALMKFPIMNVGGLVGQGLGDVVSCVHAGSLSVSETGSPLAELDQASVALNIGGVIGSAGEVDTSVDSAAASMHGEVRGCSNAGSMRVHTPSQNGLDRFGQVSYAQSSNVGGIAGYSRASIYGCSNEGDIDAERAAGVAGIVGSERARITSLSFNGNYSEVSSDDGRQADPIVVDGCSNAGSVKGFAFAAGIAGRAGSYTAINGCVNREDAWIAAVRWNKPFPAGIVGSSSGKVTYCANAGKVVSARIFEFGKNGAAPKYTTSGGYFASGIAGNLTHFMDKEGARTSPLPEMYGCYNVGSVMAQQNMRQRALVGDNSGIVHDCLALQGCVSTGRLVYGDGPGDTETSGGTSWNCRFATSDELKGVVELSDSQGANSVSWLNENMDASDGTTFWVKAPSGYPVLNFAVDWDPLDISTATASLESNASYTGIESVPRVKVVSANGSVLRQNVDYLVVPQDGAVEVSGGSAPYEATVQGIGNYSGTLANKVSYGIDAGDLAVCTVTIDSKVFNAAWQKPADNGVRVLNAAGGVVDPSEYTFRLDPDDQHVKDGQAQRAGKYKVIVSASATSTHFVGTNKEGVFSIKVAQISCPKDDKGGNFARPTKVSAGGVIYDWFSSTLNPNTEPQKLKTFEYTGHPILPKVEGVVLTGSTVEGSVDLVEGTDYRVLYGAQVGDDPTQTNATTNSGVKGGSSVGYVTVRYVAGGNYGNYEVMRFRVVDTPAKNDLSQADVAGDGDVVFEEGVDQYRPISLSFAGSKLEEGADYSIEYRNNDKPGTASFTATALPDSEFTGSLSGEFKILAEDPYVLDYSFDEASKTASVTGLRYRGTKDSFDLVIPDKVERGGTVYAVTSIAEGAFGSSNVNKVPEDAGKIASVSIPASVESVGAYAFCSANLAGGPVSGLSKVTFAEGSRLKVIGKGAFEKTSIENLTIPASVASIEEAAFAKNEKLSSVTFLSVDPVAPTFSTKAFAGTTGVKARVSVKATGLIRALEPLVANQSWKIDVIDGPQDQGWKRLAGATALDTMNEIATEAFDSADTVIIARADGFHDALSASALAGVFKAPILMTDTYDLSEQTASVIRRLRPNRAIICGGEAAVSDRVGSRITALGVDRVDRVAGSDAVETANAISREVRASAQGASSSRTFVVATSSGFHDALSSAPYAYATGSPIFLANPWNGVLDDTTLAAIKEGGFTRAVIAGGTAAVDGRVEDQIRVLGISDVVRKAGPSAYETSVELAAWACSEGLSANRMGVATAKGYYDALTGAALCGKFGSVLILADEGYDSYAIERFVALHSAEISRGYIFGGTAAVASSVQSDLEAATS